MSTGDLWGEFPRDPRSAANAHLRASDADREIVNRVLADGYADGRLDRVELDERQTRLTTAKTLGELPGLVNDLVPTASTVPGPVADRAALVGQATQRFRGELRQAVWGLISASLICWTIWLATDPGFPWPLFVMLGTGLNAGRVAFQREEIIDSEVRRLEKKELKRHLKQSRELPPPDTDQDPP